jgi:hypothetical protein
MTKPTTKTIPLADLPRGYDPFAVWAERQAQGLTFPEAKTRPCPVCGRTTEQAALIDYQCCRDAG